MTKNIFYPSNLVKQFYGLFMGGGIIRYYLD